MADWKVRKHFKNLKHYSKWLFRKLGILYMICRRWAKTRNIGMVHPI